MTAPWPSVTVPVSEAVSLACAKSEGIAAAANKKAASMWRDIMRSNPLGNKE
jgi:hypothetical protein